MTARADAGPGSTAASAAAGRRPVVMLTSSYPRFPGDGIGSFVEPIAHGVSAYRPVHLVAPWHPAVQRPAREGNVHFHFYRYAPVRRLHVFGYAAALRADVAVRPSVYAAAPLALAAGCRMARRVARATGAEIVHAHWVIPSGVIAAVALAGMPLLVSLHGSDVFVAERYPLLGAAARYAFRRAGAVTACSADLRRRAIRGGARSESSVVVPYGVDTDRFAPDPAARTAVRQAHDLADDAPVVVAAGRLARKKGFEYLIDAAAGLMHDLPALTLVILGAGDLTAELRRRAAAGGVEHRVRFAGAVPQREVAAWFSAADVVAVPSVHDEAGNVDGLPNVLLEALASASPVVTTPVGGIGTVVQDGVTARVVPERDAAALGAGIGSLLASPAAARQLGAAARDAMRRGHSWARVAERFETLYEQVVTPPNRIARP